MNETWTWNFTDPAGNPATSGIAPESFASQEEAETWLGATYEQLIDEGIEASTLMRDGEKIYGPMSLLP